MTKIQVSAAGTRDYAAMFKFLALSPTIEQDKQSQQLRLRHGDKSISITAAELSLLANKGLITRKDNLLSLTEPGREFVPVEALGQNIEVTMTEEGPRLINRDESPLSALANRRQTDGSTFLLSGEYEAGERIRSDFTRAMLMPRTTANWHASVTSGRRYGGSNGVEEITHSAIAARNRLDTALQCLGHDLAGVVTDICCYLKGLEQVEMERKWPRRSAKFMLKAALATLALHYNPPVKSTRKSHRWGTSDYRPKIS